MIDLSAPAQRLIRASPTFKAWRVELVHRLGETSELVPYTSLSSGLECVLTWCKGERLARLLSPSPFKRR